MGSHPRVLGAVLSIVSPPDTLSCQPASTLDDGIFRHEPSGSARVSSTNYLGQRLDAELVIFQSDLYRSTQQLGIDVLESLVVAGH